MRGVTKTQTLASREALTAWVAFLRAHATLVDVLNQELQEEVGLPLSWYDVLAQLHDASDGRLRMQDLAAAIMLSKSGLTRLVDRLERAGLVERTSCPSDRRGTYAAITADGRHALAAARPTHLRGVYQHFASRLTGEELAVLRAAAAKLVDSRPCNATGGRARTFAVR